MYRGVLVVQPADAEELIIELDEAGSVGNVASVSLSVGAELEDVPTMVS